MKYSRVISWLVVCTCICSCGKETLIDRVDEVTARPFIRIISPRPFTDISNNEEVVFQLKFSDYADDNTDLEIGVTSSIDGPLFSGSPVSDDINADTIEFIVPRMTAGIHEVVATITDTDGNRTNDTMFIDIFERLVPASWESATVAEDGLRLQWKKASGPGFRRYEVRRSWREDVLFTTEDIDVVTFFDAEPVPFTDEEYLIYTVSQDGKRESDIQKFTYEPEHTPLPQFGAILWMEADLERRLIYMCNSMNFAVVDMNTLKVLYTQSTTNSNEYETGSIDPATGLAYVLCEKGDLFVYNSSTGELDTLKNIDGSCLNVVNSRFQSVEHIGDNLIAMGATATDPLTLVDISNGQVIDCSEQKIWTPDLIYDRETQYLYAFAPSKTDVFLVANSKFEHIKSETLRPASRFWISPSGAYIFADNSRFDIDLSMGSRQDYYEDFEIYCSDESETVLLGNHTLLSFDAGEVMRELSFYSIQAALFDPEREKFIFFDRRTRNMIRQKF